MSKFLDLEAAESSQKDEGDEVQWGSDSDFDQPPLSQKHGSFRKAARRMKKVAKQVEAREKKFKKAKTEEPIDLTEEVLLAYYLHGLGFEIYSCGS